MYAELIPVLACPWCRAGGLTPDRALPSGERVMDLTLNCPACSKASQVTDGIWMAMGPAHRQRSIAQYTNVWPNAIFYESLWRPGALNRFSGRRFPLAEELGELTAALTPKPGDLMIDIAASEGLYARTLSASGATVLAVEHSIPFLRKVLRRAQRANARVVPVYAIAQRLPVIDGACQGVAIGGSMNEIGDRLGATAEMTRVAAPGASVFSMHLLTARTPFGRALQAGIRPAGIGFASSDEWNRLFTTHGLELVSDHIDAIVERLHLRKRAGA